MKAIVAVLLATGLTGACTAEDPLARPLPQPTMPAPDSPRPPLPAYVERLDKPAIAVKVDVQGKGDMGSACAGALAEDCR